MSNTRYAQPGSPMNQNRFASSDLARGLLGNLVAMKCATVESSEDRELLWWLQSMSHTEGGLASIAAEVLTRRPEALTKPTEQRSIASEVEAADRFSPENIGRIQQRLRDSRKLFERQIYAADMRNNIPEKIAALCLDPARPVSDYWLGAVLGQLKTEFTQQAEAAFAHTTLSRMVWREILDAHQIGGTVLLHGGSGNGQSYSAKACCDAHPGRARYALTPSTNDEITFLRAVAKSVGCASGLSFKAVQIRERILQTMLSGDLVLVIDAAQWLFPVTDYRYALPNRLNWVLTALSAQGVPVVMIADSKMFDTLGLVEARTGWSRNTFVNQLSRVVQLPAALPKEDVLTVAGQLLADGDRAAQRKLADYMIIAPGYLHSGAPAAQRARRIAASHQRGRIMLADMEQALEISMKPSFLALEAGLKRADAAARGCKAKVRNWRPETPAQIAAKSGKRRNQIVTSSDIQATGKPDGRVPADAVQPVGARPAAPQFLPPRRYAAGDVPIPVHRATTPDLATV